MDLFLTTYLTYDLSIISYDNDHTLVRPSSNLSTTLEINGRLRKLPMTGTLLRNCTVAGMNPPNKRTKPYVSIIIPINGYPMRTTEIPAKNAMVALTLCF
ncbi:CLUMA_CG019215, isoform A [Clunio marinus]|uniref:CLUMA_CG019215, isoform A n=1 Tax=Clunio marinus TaxID=568069 RepID=A0A1J1J4R7_9DIPT|nr:CLUMA_CG019215, isoform A [Clunio marinus]